MNHYENIHAYIDGELSEEEARQFEEALKSDKGLADEVDIEKTLRRGIMAAGLREQMSSFAQGGEDKEKKPGARVIDFNNYRSLAIAASLAILLGFFLWQTRTSPAGDSNPFASVYYEDPGTPVKMGETEDKAFDEAMINYKNEDYEQAKEAFARLCQDSGFDKACYYEAQSLLNSGELEGARDQFSALLSRTDDLELREKSQWYLAYTLYQLDDETYKSILSDIAEDDAHRFNLEAREVMK